MAKPDHPAKPEKQKKPADAGAAKASAAPSEPAPPPRFHEKYVKEVRPALKQRFGLKNDLAVPRFSKIVLNMGVGKARENKALIEHAAGDLATIAGQKPKITRAKAAVSGFRLREGMPIGCMVTLRGKRMYEFLDRLISVAIPRIKDFRGLSRKSFDGRGNYSMGLSEQGVFPEIRVDNLQLVQGLDVTICTTAGEDAKAEALLEAMGMPFRAR
jgi:large subunit ribosomal protein L5